VGNDVGGKYGGVVGGDEVEFVAFEPVYTVASTSYPKVTRSGTGASGRSIRTWKKKIIVNLYSYQRAILQIIVELFCYSGRDQYTEGNKLIAHSFASLMQFVKELNLLFECSLLIIKTNLREQNK
jgi:hypothetical protein